MTDLPRLPRLRAAALYAAVWSPVAIGFSIALAATRGLPWPTAIVAGIMSTLPAALLGLAVVALCRRLAARRVGRAAFAAAHAGAAVAYAVLWCGAIITQMWAGAPSREIGIFMREGLAWQLVTGLLTYAVLAGVAHARIARRRQAEHERRAARAETLRLRAELESLRARLDPHFLFNVLQTLGALMTDRPADAHAALEHLAGLLKRRLDAGRGGDDDVSLAEELADVREYCALERLRLGERLRVVEEIDPATLGCLVPPFTLQPLVENAIRHGLAPRAGPGRLTIAARRRGDAWTLTVADDGAGADPARVEGGTGVGLPVVRERLRLRFDGRATVAVDTAPGRGCAVELTLPVVTDEGDETTGVEAA